MKHGLHFAVANEGGRLRAHFYPNQSGREGQAELPSVRLTPDGAEVWLRRTFDACRFLAAVLRTLFVSRFGRDPVNAWDPPTEPSAALAVEAIEESLRRVKVPVLEWISTPIESTTADDLPEPPPPSTK